MKRSKAEIRKSRNYTVKGLGQKNRQVWQHETAFKYIEIDGFTVELFWVSKNSINGWQVLGVAHGGDDEFYCERSTGGGYDKEAHVLNHVFLQLGVKPKDWTEGRNNLDRYHVGGNFYRVPKTLIRVYK